MAVLTGAPLVAALLPELRASLARLETTVADPAAPLDQLRLATLLRAQAALLAGVAAELELRVHEDLGRFGAAVVERAAHARSPEAAASEVADAFLHLCRPSGEAGIMGA
jgi:hypothetical protein